MDAEKLEGLLTKEMVAIYRYLMKMGAGKEDAEDIVQDTLCKALEYIEGVETEKMRGWLFRVALNSYFNLCKRKKRESLGLDGYTLSTLCTQGVPEKEVLDGELKQEMERAFGSLSPGDRELIAMKYVAGFSHREMAEILGFNEDTIKTYLYRARNRFRKLWEASNHDP